MAKQVINIGTGELTGDGETLRSAFSKLNDNFTELYAGGGSSFDTKFSSLTGTPTTIAGYGITDSPDSLLDLNIIDGTSGQVLTTDGSGNFTFTSAGGGGAGLNDGSGNSTVTTSSVTGVTATSTISVNLVGGAAAPINIGASPSGIVTIGSGTNTVDYPSGTTVDFTGAIITGTSFATSAQGTKADNALQPMGISVSTLANAGSGKLEYVGDSAPNTGVFTYTPPALDALVASNTTEIAIGDNAGAISQGDSSISIGSSAGKTSQGDKAVAIGRNAGETNQDINTVAIGNDAGKTTQGNSAVAIGYLAGETTQGGSAVAIGRQAGNSNQGLQAVALGNLAGFGNQAANSIVINATGSILENTQASSLVVKPVRNASGTHALEYNPTTGEVTYDALGAGGGYSDSDVDTHLNQSNPTSGYVLTWNGTDYAWTANGTGSGIGDIVDDTTPQLGGNLDAQAFDITTTGKILYSNMYATTGDLPSATTYHGMFAHVHGTGKGYFAHAGNWVELANAATTLAGYGITDGYVNTDVDTHLNQSNPTSGYVLSWNGTDYAWVAQSGGGGATTWANITDINNSSGPSEIAIGNQAGTSQGNNAIAIGKEAGQSGQGTNAVAIGWQAGESAQSSGAVALGQYAGQTSQSGNAVAIGQGAGTHQQGGNAIAIGQNAGAVSQAANSIVLNASSSTVNNTVADSFVVKPIRNASGTHALEYNPTTGEVTYDALGGGGGSTTWAGITDINNASGPVNIAIGYQAGITTQGFYGTAIGYQAGMTNQGQNAISIGREAGEATQGVSAVAIGYQAGEATQGDGAVALGQYAGQSGQGQSAVAIGIQAGLSNQGLNAIAIGNSAGASNQAANSIVFNATTGTLNNTVADSFVVKPVRNAVGTTVMMYDATTGEVTHSSSLKLDVGVEEKFSTHTGSTGVVTQDCSAAALFYHTGATADFTVNFTNINSTAEYAKALAVIVTQGGTGYIPSAVQIGGVAQTIEWSGNSAPTGTANGIDAFSFTILNDGGTYVVLGIMTSFG